MPNQHVSVAISLFELALRRDHSCPKLSGLPNLLNLSNKINMPHSKFTENVTQTFFTEEEYISASTKLELAQQTRNKVAREAVKHEPNLRRLVALCNTLDAYADALRDFHATDASEEPWSNEEDAEVKPYSVYVDVQVQITECDSDSDSEDEDEDGWSESSSDEEQDEEDSWSDNSTDTMVGDDDEELSKGMKDMWLQPTSLKQTPAWTARDLLALGT
jgi:hypothetical protein